ncbi:MAG: hypothetical protein WD080_01605 [Egibacteraceae bacterium]
MRPRLLLVLLSLALAATTVAPAAAAPSPEEDAAVTAKPECDDPVTVADGTPVLFESLGELLPTRTAALPLGLGACTGVRPGATVLNDVGLCSFNYLFHGSDGQRYMGTAGHCVLGAVPGEQTWAPGSGPVARDATGNRVGEFAYAVLGGVRDFALVRLDDGVPASPQMCHFGGPTGINEDLSPGPVILQHYGQALVFGQLLPARTSIAPTTSDPNQVFANGLALFGDSGGAVNSADGRAMGVLVTVGLHLGGVTNVGTIGVTRIAPQVAQAKGALGLSALEMQLAPQL